MSDFLSTVLVVIATIIVGIPLCAIAFVVAFTMLKHIFLRGGGEL
jgi:hypothetical protein